MSEKKEKKTGKFKAFLHTVFVKNIDLKLFSLAFAIIITVLIIGLGG